LDKLTATPLLLLL